MLLTKKQFCHYIKLSRLQTRFADLLYHEADIQIDGNSFFWEIDNAILELVTLATYHYLPEEERNQLFLADPTNNTIEYWVHELDYGETLKKYPDMWQQNGKNVECYTAEQLYDILLEEEKEYKATH